MLARLRIRKSGFSNCVRGNIAITFGMTAPVLLMLVGLSVDYGAWFNQRTKLQAAADAAALAGAKIYAQTQDANAADVEAYASLNGHDAAGAHPSTNLVDGNTAYKVALQEPGVQYFSGIFPIGPPTIGVAAKASIATGPGPCILTLDPSAGHSLWLDSNSQISALKCKVHANSSSSEGVYAASNSQLNAELTCVVGDYGGADSHYNPDPRAGCAPANDPMAHIPAPSTSGCDFSDHELDDATTDLNPGVYCGGLTIKGNSNVTFRSGTYIMKDGRFFVDSNSRVRGDGVTFYLTGSQATIEFTSNTEIDFTAPTTGSLAGVLFFEDRNSPWNRSHYFDSNNISRLEGAIYLSRGVLWFDSNSQIAANSAFTTIVVNRLRLDSNAQLVVNTDYDSSAVPALIGAAAGGIRLIE